MKNINKFNKKLLSITIGFCLSFGGLNSFSSTVYASKDKNKDFVATIGNSSNTINMDETITLTGKNKVSDKNSNENLALPLSQEVKQSDVTNINNSLQQSSSLPIQNNKNMTIEEVLNQSDVMTFEGGNKKRKIVQNSKSDTKVQNMDEKILNDSEKIDKAEVDFSKSQGYKYTDIVKEIPIPKDFGLLDDKVSSMPLSGAPQGLPSFNFKVVIDDSDLRKMVKSINNKNKTLGNDNAIHFEDNQHHASLNKIRSGGEENLKTVFLNSVEKLWLDALRKESQLMMLSGLPMKILIVPSQDDLMFNFMKGTIGRSIGYKKIDDGIFSILGKPYINGKEIPMCFIAFDDVIEGYNDKILKPLEAKIGKEATASFIVGKHVGFCLDDLERQNKVSKTNTWFSNEVAKIGLYSKSFQALYPLGLRSNLYKIKEEEILSNNAQKQYQQRIADSFGVLWAYNRGFKQVYKSFLDFKQNENVKNYSIYNTAIAVKNLSSKLIYMETNKITLSKIWKIARENQKLMGVDKSLALVNYDRVFKPEVSDLRKEKQILNTQDMKHMDEVKRMNGKDTVWNFVNKTEKDGMQKAKQNTKQNGQNSFENTKNNQLSKMNFNVGQLLREGVDENLKNNKVSVFEKQQKTTAQINKEKQLKKEKNKTSSSKDDKNKTLVMSKNNKIESQTKDEKTIISENDKKKGMNKLGYTEEKIQDNLRNEIIFEIEGKTLSIAK